MLLWTVVLSVCSVADLCTRFVGGVPVRGLGSNCLRHHASMLYQKRKGESGEATPANFTNNGEEASSGSGKEKRKGWLILQYEDHAPIIKPHRSECT